MLFFDISHIALKNITNTICDLVRNLAQSSNITVT